MLRFFRFHAWYGQPPFDGPSFDACRRNAATLSGLSGERVRKELLRTLDARRRRRCASTPCVEAGVLDHWLPEYAGSARLRALIAREDEARCAAPAGGDPAGGRRCDGDRQAAEALDAGIRAPASSCSIRRTAIDIAGGHMPGAPASIVSARLFIDRLLPASTRPATGARRLRSRGSWTPPELPIGGGDALALGLKPGPKVGALIEAVERWWIAGDFSADRDACLAELKRLADACMIRPGLTFVLWLAIALFIVVNDVVGDTWIAATLTVRTVEWYKVLVPLPYVAMLAIIHARRTAGPRWFEAALLAALLWPVSTVLVDFLYGRLTLRGRAGGVPRPLRRAVSVADREPVSRCL